MTPTPEYIPLPGPSESESTLPAAAAGVKVRRSFVVRPSRTAHAWFDPCVA